MVRLGRKFVLYGDDNWPPLPAAWTVVEKDRFLIAVAPDGEDFFVEDLGRTIGLVRRCVAGESDFVRTDGKLKVGQIFAGDHLPTLSFTKP